MSLTSLLEGSPALRDYLRATLPLPTRPKLPVLVASPQTTRYSLIGTAFDYAFRWHCQVRCPNAICRDNWVADHLTVISSSAELRTAAAASTWAARYWLDYARGSGCYPLPLLQSAIELARLDTIYRSGKGFEDIGQPIDPGDIADLIRLVRAIPPELANPQEFCLLNPVFNQGLIVGGADADVVLGDTLIEIKVTKNPKIERIWIDQLLGYYLLYRYGGFHGLTEQPEVTHIGIYFARHGTLLRWPVVSFGSEQVLDAAVVRLREHCGDLPHGQEPSAVDFLKEKAP